MRLFGAAAAVGAANKNYIFIYARCTSAKKEYGDYLHQIL
jgi:hypothetical protein